MNENQRVAFVISQVACAMIEAMGMLAENNLRLVSLRSLAYGEQAFAVLIDKYKIGHNDVISFLK